MTVLIALPQRNMRVEMIEQRIWGLWRRSHAGHGAAGITDSQQCDNAFAHALRPGPLRWLQPCIGTV